METYIYILEYIIILALIAGVLFYFEHRNRNKTIVTLTNLSITKRKVKMTINLDPTSEAFGTLQYSDAEGNAKKIESPTIIGGVSRVVEVREWTSNVNGVESVGTELDVAAYSDDFGITEITVKADPLPGDPEGELDYAFNIDVQSIATNVNANFSARPRT